MRILPIVAALVIALWAAWPAEAGGVCLTRDEAIRLIAHKVDVEWGGVLDKRIVWAIADRESGLQHCDAAGRVKVSPTNDHGLLQLNPAGVWRNCRVNPYCDRPTLIDDPSLQIDVMLAYAAAYGDLCPWNPDPAGRYLPGCGYGQVSEPGRRETTMGAGLGAALPKVSQADAPDGDGPARPQRGGPQ